MDPVSVWVDIVVWFLQWLEAELVVLSRVLLVTLCLMSACKVAAWVLLIGIELAVCLVSVVIVVAVGIVADPVSVDWRLLMRVLCCSCGALKADCGPMKSVDGSDVVCLCSGCCFAAVGFGVFKLGGASGGVCVELCCLRHCLKD